jgi:hypothetical protein
MKKEFEQYIRGLNEVELEQFLTEKEQEYSAEEVRSEESQDHEEKLPEQDDIKSHSDISEIPQEEIILMSNVGNAPSQETTCSSDAAKKASGKH